MTALVVYLYIVEKCAIGLLVPAFTTVGHYRIIVETPVRLVKETSVIPNPQVVLEWRLGYYLGEGKPRRY